jgi:hypothetical protein
LQTDGDARQQGTQRLVDHAGSLSILATRCPVSISFSPDYS